MKKSKSFYGKVGSLIQLPILICLLLWCGSGAAQSPDENTNGNTVASEAIVDSTRDAPKDLAKQYYQQGIDLFEAGEFTASADAFRSAYDQKATWKLFYNIGQAEAAAKRYGLALEAFETYLVKGGDSVVEERREQILAEIRRIRVLVGVLKVNCPDGAELFVDGTSRGVAPFQGHIQVAAGAHQVIVRKDGRILADEQVRLSGGMTTEIDAVGDADGDAVASEPSVPEDDVSENVSTSETDDGRKGVLQRPLMISGIVSGGLGVAGLVLGAVYGIKALDYETKYTDAATMPEADKWEKKYDDANTMVKVGFIAGGTLVAAGATLIILDVVRSKKTIRSVRRWQPTAGGLTVSF